MLGLLDLDMMMNICWKIIMNKLELTDSEIKYLKNLVQWNPSEEAQSIMGKINSSHKMNSLEGKGVQINCSGVVPIYSIGQKSPGHFVTIL